MTRDVVKHRHRRNEEEIRAAARAYAHAVDEDDEHDSYITREARAAARARLDAALQAPHV